MKKKQRQKALKNELISDLKFEIMFYILINWLKMPEQVMKPEMLMLY